MEGSEGGFYKADDQQAATAANESAGVHWSASEFVEHQKNAGWYALLLIATVMVCALVFIFTRDYFAPVIIMLLALAFGISAGKRPRTLDYVIDAAGINAGAKHFDFESFKAFTVMQEGPIESIVLLPAKRWMPPLNLYFAPEDADRIVDGLGSFLPYEEKSKGLVDSFLHRIRF